jgi:hypothetical protein
MKRLTVVSRAVLALVVLASLAACSGGVFFDPGQDAAYGFGSGGGGGGSRGGAKPSSLSSGASFDEAYEKLWEIYEYCEDHPGTINDGIKLAIDQFGNTFINLESSWSGTVAQGAITAINSYISQLQ